MSEEEYTPVIDTSIITLYLQRGLGRHCFEDEVVVAVGAVFVAAFRVDLSVCGSVTHNQGGFLFSLCEGGCMWK